MALTISDTAAAAILTAALVDPVQYDTTTVRIDTIPTEGPCTVRVTQLLEVDSATVRSIFRADMAELEGDE